MNISKVFILSLFIEFIFSLPFPSEPLSNYEKVKEANKLLLQINPFIPPDYDLFDLMLMWQHPKEHDCMEWAPAISRNEDGLMEYSWCGNYFCTFIFTRDDVIIERIELLSY